MNDCNVRHFDLEPGDSDIRLMIVRGTPSNTRKLEKGFYEKNQCADGGVWYYAKDKVTVAKPFGWYHLPNVKDLTESNKNNNEE